MNTRRSFDAYAKVRLTSVYSMISLRRPLTSNAQHATTTAPCVARLHGGIIICGVTTRHGMNGRLSWASGYRSLNGRRKPKIGIRSLHMSPTAVTTMYVCLSGGFSEVRSHTHQPRTTL